MLQRRPTPSAQRAACISAQHVRRCVGTPANDERHKRGRLHGGRRHRSAAIASTADAAVRPASAQRVPVVGTVLAWDRRGDHVDCACLMIRNRQGTRSRGLRPVRKGSASPSRSIRVCAAQPAAQQAAAGPVRGFLPGVPVGLLGHGGQRSEVEAPALRGGNSGAGAGATRGCVWTASTQQANAGRGGAFRVVAAGQAGSQASAQGSKPLSRGSRGGAPPAIRYRSPFALRP
jgi:hypothetical protein